MKKKAIFLSVIVIVIVLASVVYFYKYAGNMVSQNIESVESIIIANYPYDENKIIVKDEDEINKIFDMLLQTSHIINNRHPSHMKAIEHDPEFTIDIKYIDGKTDKLFAAGKTGYIGRFLNSRGNSGDRGYRMGKNQMIWEYLTH